jgi:Bacterial flagellin N-terminal helical region
MGDNGRVADAVPFDRRPAKTRRAGSQASLQACRRSVAPVRVRYVPLQSDIPTRTHAMSSILTNNSALSALQSLTTTQKSLQTTQNQISSGLKIATAADNAGYWSIATQTSPRP